ncbi:hypothetical protein C8R44DRAFT_752643 [Mycena epipterygia]|nr:hypothetical protein C8R44DRAFT_752643 [Mycena epipterygia]
MYKLQASNRSAEHDDIDDGITTSSSLTLLASLVTERVRNGLNPTRVFLQQATRDSPQPTSAGYSIIWSINLNDASDAWNVGAEVDGVKLVLNDASHSLFDFPPCAT